MALSWDEDELAHSGTGFTWRAINYMLCQTITYQTIIGTSMADGINQDYSLGGFGERLKAAREALNLSQKDVAVRLHLNPDILQILETENFEKAPPATFLRGYLRSYARFLNFNEDDINAALTQSAFESQTSALHTMPILPSQTMQMGDRYVQWISTAVVLGLFIFVGIWWGLHSSTSNNTENTLARAPAAQPSSAIAPALPTPQSQSASTHSPSPHAAEIPASETQTPPPSTMATTQQPAAQPTTMPASNPANPPVAATTVPALPSAPLMTPIDPAALQPTVADNDESPKKRRRHRQDNNVSGFAMALPEPGL